MGKNTQIAELINYLSVDGSGNIVMTGNLIMPGGAQAATQTYVNSAISNLVNAAPTALDTLAELSTALNNDASFATTVTNSLASKLGLSGGTLTGALTGTSASFSSSVTGSNFYAPSNTGFWSDTFDVRRNGFVADGTNLVFRAGNSSTGEQTRMVIAQASGNVGIGTTSPKELLEIAGLNGNIRIYGRGGVTQNGISSNVYYNGSSWVRDNGSTGSGAIRFDSDTNSIVFNTDTSTSGFPAERLRITSAGRIIVNNSVANDSGDRNLTIQGSLSATLNDVASINLAQIWNGVAYPAILAVQQDLTYGNASGAFVLKTSYWNGSSVSTGERLRVTGVGKVGIGTNSPDAYLHINSSTAQLKISGNTNSFAIYSWNGGVNLFASENLYLGRDAAVNNKIYFQNAAGSTTTMYVDTAGDKVGIGNISPLEKLSVSGNIHVAGVGNVLYFDTDASGRSISQYVTNLYEFHILNGRGNSSRFVLGNGSISLGTSSIPLFYINTSSGNVGMGTSSPGYNLVVQGSEAKFHLNNINTGGGSWILASTYNGWSAGGGKFVVTSDGGSAGIKFAIDSSGNVGIGTYTFSDLGFATPLLKVAGSRATLGLVSSGTLSTIALVSSNNNSTAMHLNYENTGAFRWYNYSSATETFTLLGNGRLGLGVQNPDARLHVGGAILVSNNSQTYRRAITCHGQNGTYSQVKVKFNKTSWGSVTYDIKLASAGGTYHTAGCYYSNPGFSSNLVSINAGNGPSMSLIAEDSNGGTQGATWTFSGVTMIHPIVTVDIACGNGYQVNPDDITVQFN